MSYFSEKERGLKPRIEEIIVPSAWGGIVALIHSLILTGGFGHRFPEICPDGEGPVGTDEQTFSLALKAEIPDVDWPLKTSMMQDRYPHGEEPYAPDTLSILDLIQFCYRSVSKPIQAGFHSFFRHYHLTFDESAGREEFREKINTIFARNGIAFELLADGSIIRLAPPVIREALSNPFFRTQDITLNEMLEEARIKYLNPDPNVRREAIERLWDCWERIKTLEIPRDKKASMGVLLDKAAGQPDVRALLEEEAKKLTEIGNTFHIRHAEVKQVRIHDGDIMDYLFHRLFSLIQLLLKKR